MSALPENTSSRVLIEILEARTRGNRHALLITTRPDIEPVRILVVYRANGWRPGLSPSLRNQEQVLALAARSPHATATRTIEWELTFEEAVKTI